MKLFQLILCIFCSLNSGFSHSAIINYSVQGLVTNTDIVDINGNPITGRIANITFEYDDILSTSNMNYSYVTTPFTMSISVAGTYASSTSTNTYFESWNDAYDVFTCSDSFNGFGNGLSFIFEQSVASLDYCGANTPTQTLLNANVTAPDGSFKYQTGRVKIGGFGYASIQYVPVPAAVWLFFSGIIGLFSISYRKKYNQK